MMKGGITIETIENGYIICKVLEDKTVFSETWDRKQPHVAKTIEEALEIAKQLLEEVK